MLKKLGADKHNYCDERTSVTVLIPLFAFSLTTHCFTFSSTKSQFGKRELFSPWQHPPNLSITAKSRHPLWGTALIVLLPSFLPELLNYEIHMDVFSSHILPSEIATVQPRANSDLSGRWHFHT